MSLFQLLKTLTKEINSIMGKFWWGFKENVNKFHGCVGRDWGEIRIWEVWVTEILTVSI